MLKDSAPTAMVIHFLGGIHEIYFPYVLAHPIMVLAMIAGGLSADLWFTISGAGLVATPSPGSIFAYLAVTPKTGYFPVFTGVLIGAVVSFLVGAAILKVFPVKEEQMEEQTAEEAGSTSTAAIPGLS
jgi:PTS system mannitol-specific IIC component